MQMEMGTTKKPLRYVAQIAPLMATLLVYTASVSQAEVIFRIGFESSEYPNADDSPGATLWGADGSTTHGKDVPLDGTTTRAGNFSIPGHSTRWLIDDSNARSGTQSVRLSESAPDC